MDQSLHRARARVRVLVLGLGVIILFLSSVGVFLYLKPGGSTPTKEELPVFVAGPLDGFELGTASYFQLENVYIVRIADDLLLALYDLGPNSQARVQDGDLTALECRIQFVEDENGWAGLGTPPPGFEDRVFWESCQGNFWDAAGRHLAGAAAADMDRFPLTIVDGVVHVDVNNRICVNPISPAAPCITTQ